MNEQIGALAWEIGWIRGKMEGFAAAEIDVRIQRAERVAISGIIILTVSVGIALASLLL